jgi:hypothetical protein
MDDPHQLNTILTAAICKFFKDRDAVPLRIEEAKLLGKEIVGALEAAGLGVTTKDQPGN